MNTNTHTHTHTYKLHTNAHAQTYTYKLPFLSSCLSRDFSLISRLFILAPFIQLLLTWTQKLNLQVLALCFIGLSLRSYRKRCVCK